MHPSLQKQHVYRVCNAYHKDEAEGLGLDEPRRAPCNINEALACAEDLYTKIIDKAREKNQQAIAEKNAQTNKQQDDLDAVAAAKHENALQELVAHTVQKMDGKIHPHGDVTMLYDAQGNLAEPGAPIDASASTGEMAQKFVTAVSGNKKAEKQNVKKQKMDRPRLEGRGRKPTTKAKEREKENQSRTRKVVSNNSSACLQQQLNLCTELPDKAVH